MSMLETIQFEFFENGGSFSETSFPSLECLEFDKMPCWEVWHHSYNSFPVLKSLVIRDCPRLRGNLPTHLPALEAIQIEKCKQLTFSLTNVPAIRKLVILESNKVSLHEIPLLLEQLKIQGREVTESFFEAIAIIPPISLQSLEIHDCPSRISFPGDYLPASLRILTITGCRNLDFPKQNHLHELLQQLSIVKSCDSLITLPLDALPNLRSLYISQCTNLECLSLSKILKNLHDFTIQSCPKLVSFPVEGLIAPNLTSFNIYKCVSLKSLPCHVNTLLPKLDTVTIYDCPEMETFPERGMPRSLRSLYITNCEILLRSPSLTSMDMLTRLSITGPCNGVGSFPKEGFALLPPSLTSLDLTRFSSLHTLECTGILHLVSLRILTIRECPKLKNIAGERLPASLILFRIFGCPRLKERCRVKHPQIWPKVSHIRGIMGDDGTWIS